MHTPADRHLPPTFNRLALSNLAAQSAEQVALAAAPIVAVLALGAGPAESGWLQTAQTLPFLLVALPAGVLADRMSLRVLMAGSEALRVVALVAVLALLAGGLLTLPFLALLGLLAACGTVVYGVAAPSLVPALVPPVLLATANGRIELARTLAFAGGPALAGTLVAWAGAPPAFALAALMSAGAVLLLAGLDEPPRTPPPRRYIGRELADGATFVLRHPLLRPVFVTQVVFNAAFFVLQAAYVPYAALHLGLDAGGIGVTLAACGVGMVAGALAAPRLMRRLSFGVVVAIGPIAGFAAALTMMATIRMPSAALAASSFFLFGAGPILWVIVTTTLRQTTTPHGLLGRVSAIFVTAQGARPVGAAIGALLGGLYGAETCLVVAAVGFLLQAAIILASPVVVLARQPEMAGSG